MISILSILSIYYQLESSRSIKCYFWNYHEHNSALNNLTHVNTDFWGLVLSPDNTVRQFFKWSLGVCKSIWGFWRLFLYFAGAVQDQQEIWKMTLIFLGFQSSLIFDKQPLAHWCYLAKLQSENADIEDRCSCCKPVSRVIELWNTSGAKCTNNLLSCPPNQYPVELISFAEQIIEHSMK